MVVLAVNKGRSESPGAFSRWVAKTPQIARVHSAESGRGIPIRLFASAT
jgi:hypothetical protein